MIVKVSSFKVIAASSLVVAGLVAGAAEAQVRAPYGARPEAGQRQAAAPLDSRARIGLVTEEMAKQGYRLLPGESYKAVHEKMSLAVIAPAGHYAAVAVPDDSCASPEMALEDRKAGKHYGAMPLGDALVAYFEPEKDTEVFMTMTSGDSRCFAYLLAFGH